jgi:hypothetical protein
MVRKHQTRNLETPGSMLRTAPEMTARLRHRYHFFTSGQRDISSGWNAWSPETVPSSL